MAVNVDNIKAQMRKGILEYCILSIISRGDQNNQGLLSYRWEESPQGPPRKYYTITDLGREYLAALDVAWQEFVTQIGMIRNGSVNR